MTKLEKLLQERDQVDAKIRSYKVISINKAYASLLNNKTVPQHVKVLYNSLHKELSKGMPFVVKVSDLIDQLEVHLDL